MRRGLGRGLGLLLLLGGAGAAEAQQERAPRSEETIRVSGVGTVEVAPDEAELVFAVETEATSARAAGAENAQRMERVIEALIKAGVPRDRITTRGYSVEPQYVHDPSTGENRIRGYRARNQVVLETEALTRIGEFLDVALAAGANRVQGISFGLKDTAGASQQALARAVAQARASAETIARTLGVRLGRVLDASTSGEYIPPRPLYARMEVAATAAPGMAADTPIQAGEQTVRATVALIFAIEP